MLVGTSTANQQLRATKSKNSFGVFRSENSVNEAQGESNDVQIVALGTRLVHSNQSLPAKFIKGVCSIFCFANHRESEQIAMEYEGVLFLVSKLIQDSQTKLPGLIHVMQQLCTLWDDFSHNSHELQDEPLQGNRLEILTALKALGTVKKCHMGPKTQAEYLPDFRRVVVDAMNDRNAQILESGAHALVSVSRNFEQVCGENEYSILHSIQARATVSSPLKKEIREFLSQHHEQLPPDLRSQVNFLDDIGKLNDDDFIAEMENLLDEDDDQFVYEI